MKNLKLIGIDIEWGNGYEEEPVPMGICFIFKCNDCGARMEVRTEVGEEFECKCEIRDEKNCLYWKRRYKIMSLIPLEIREINNPSKWRDWDCWMRRYQNDSA